MRTATGLVADPSTCFTVVASPLGPLTLTGTGTAVTGIRFAGPDGTSGPTGDLRHDDGPFRDAVAQLREYFAGKRRDFDLPLAPAGTAFQQRVWAALRTVPYGETRSYGWLASEIGAPGSARAVGLANGRNPIAVVVPCHRVIGANGTLTGYAGGMERKRLLLDLESGRPTLW